MYSSWIWWLLWGCESFELLLNATDYDFGMSPAAEDFLIETHGEDVWNELKMEYLSNLNCVIPSASRGFLDDYEDDCATFSDLVEYIQEKAERNRPPTSSNMPMRMGVGLAPTKILKLDMETRILSVFVRLTLFWADPRLSYRGDLWFPNWQSNMHYVPLSSALRGDQTIWLPNVIPQRSSEDNYHEKSNEFMRIRVYDDMFLRAKGYNVVWTRNIELKSECNVYLKAFPFDQQACTLTFQDLVAPLHLSPIVRGFPTTVRNQFAINQEFYVIQSIGVSFAYLEEARTLGVASWYSASYARYFFMIERKAHYYTLNFIWPLMLTVSFAYLSFWLPFDFDRVTLTVTICVALFDIIFLIMPNRPTVAHEAWLDTFQAKCIVLTALPAVESIVLSHLVALLAKRALRRQKEERQLDKWLKDLQVAEIEKVRDLLTQQQLEFLVTAIEEKKLLEYRRNSSSVHNLTCVPDSDDRTVSSGAGDPILLEESPAYGRPSKRQRLQSWFRRKMDEQSEGRRLSSIPPVGRPVGGSFVSRVSSKTDLTPSALPREVKAELMRAADLTGRSKDDVNSFVGSENRPESVYDHQSNTSGDAAINPDITVTLPRYVDRLFQICYIPLIVAAMMAHAGPLLANQREVVDSLFGRASTPSLILMIFWVLGMCALWVAAMFSYAVNYCPASGSLRDFITRRY